jgi:two-component system, cell cycle response regulator
MPIRHIALAGFSAFETQTIESFFKLAGRRPPGYAIVPDVGMADVVLLNGDDAPAVGQMAAKPPLAAIIAIGKAPAQAGWLHMARPIRLLSVLDAIEQQMKGREPPPAPVQASAPAARSGDFESTRAPEQAAPVTIAKTWAPVPSAAPSPAPVPAASPAVEPAASPPAFRRSRGGLTGFGNSRLDDSQSIYDQKPAAPRSDDDLILVVDDSDIVLRFMQARLQRFGYAVELATNGEEAVQMVQGKDYKFVFLDVMMPGIDGYQTCRLIKKKLDANGKPPTVVMLSSRGGSIDKIRGTLAGAAAYLTKPLNEAALLKVLADHDEQTKASFGMTRPASQAASRM